MTQIPDADNGSKPGRLRQKLFTKKTQRDTKFLSAPGVFVVQTKWFKQNWRIIFSNLH
jgi:hypothetical protein